MSIPRVKICGITNPEDALQAVAAGADALGFVFYPPSPRAVDPGTVRDITAALPPFVTTVGLFVNSTVTEVLETMAAARLQVVQWHGEWPLDPDGWSGYPLIRAVPVKDESALQGLEFSEARAVLLDAWHEHLYGGSGVCFDWQLVQQLRITKPLILAGGLNPGNVAKAIRQVRPYGVDVSSGVERDPGRKDPEKVSQFIQQVRLSQENHFGDG